MVKDKVENFLSSIDAAVLGSSLPSLSELSTRERQVLDYLAQGWDNARIAQTLGLASKTIRNHVTHLFEKLGVNTRAEAIVMARDAGLGVKRAIKSMSAHSPHTGGSTHQGQMSLVKRKILRFSREIRDY